MREFEPKIRKSVSFFCASVITVKSIVARTMASETFDKACERPALEGETDVFNGEVRGE